MSRTRPGKRAGLSAVPGVRLGVDVGSVRVGVAVSDPGATLATPWATLARDAVHGADVLAVAGLARERGAVEVAVGLPRLLSGLEGAAAQTAREWAGALRRALPDVPVVLVDERLTTVTAERDLREAGVDGRRLRGVVDQAAAVTILQIALDARPTPGGHP